MAGYPGKQGRKRLPTALRVLRGTGQPGEGEPNYRAPIRLPSPPAELSDGAKREWRRTGRKLLDAGVLTEIDSAAFAAYCASYARWLEIQAQIKKSSLLYTSKRDGQLHSNPLLRLSRAAQEEFTRALVEFGMSPSSRTRLHVEKPLAVDPFAEFEGATG